MTHSHMLQTFRCTHAEPFVFNGELDKKSCE